MSGGRLHEVIQSSQRSGRHRALVHDRPKNIMNGLAQFSRPHQRLLRSLRIGITPLVQPVHLVVRQQASVFSKAREIGISLQQFFGLDVPIVERVYEVQADVARNQIKARRTAARNLFSFFEQGFLLSRRSYYLTIKTILTS